MTQTAFWSSLMRSATTVLRKIADLRHFDFDHVARLEPARRIDFGPSLTGVPVTMMSPGLSVMKVLT